MIEYSLNMPYHKDLFKFFITKYKKLINDNYANPSNYDLDPNNIRSIHTKLKPYIFLNLNNYKIRNKKEKERLRTRLKKHYGIESYILGKDFLLVKRPLLHKKHNIVSTTPYLLGYFYIENIISDLIAEITYNSYTHLVFNKKINKQITKDKDQELSILDMCAAPGGKSFGIWKRLVSHDFINLTLNKYNSNQSLDFTNHTNLITIDNNNLRFRKMIYNFERLGMLSVPFSITRVFPILFDARYITKVNLAGLFSKMLCGKSDENKSLTTAPEFLVPTILIDAPCSGNFTLDNELNWFHKHTIKDIQKLSRIQFQLVTNSIKLLDSCSIEGRGEIIYSTCSLEPEENEGVINKVLNWSREFGYKVKIISIEHELKSYISSLNKKIMTDSTMLYLNFSYDHGLTNILGKEVDDQLKRAVRFWPFKLTDSSNPTLKNPAFNLSNHSDHNKMQIIPPRPYFIVKMRKF